jgi:hypothetical protein
MGCQYTTFICNIVVRLSKLLTKGCEGILIGCEPPMTASGNCDDDDRLFQFRLDEVSRKTATTIGCLALHLDGFSECDDILAAPLASLLDRPTDRNREKIN